MFFFHRGSPDEIIAKQQKNVTSMCAEQHSLVVAQITERLNKDFDEACRVWLMLTSGQVKGNASSAADALQKYRSQNKFRLMPRVDVVDAMNRMKAGIGTAFSQVSNGKPLDAFCFMMNVDPACAIFTKTIEANKVACVERYASQGAVAEFWSGDADDLKAFGYFELVLSEADDEKYACVKHRFSDAQADLPEDERNVEWTIESNLNFHGAVLKKGVKQMSVSDLFKHVEVKIPNPPMKIDEVTEAPQTPRSSPTTSISTQSLLSPRVSCSPKISSPGIAVLQDNLIPSIGNGDVNEKSPAKGFQGHCRSLPPVGCGDAI